MNDEVRTLLVKALRSGDYKQGHRGRLAWGVQVTEDGREIPVEWEAAGVLCDLAVKAGVIVPPTKVSVIADDVTWLYRGAGDNAVPSCISIPDTVLSWAGMELALGDGLVADGVWATWAGHADRRVSFEQFASALEALPTPVAHTGEATAA